MDTRRLDILAHGHATLHSQRAHVLLPGATSPASAGQRIIPVSLFPR